MARVQYLFAIVTLCLFGTTASAYVREQNQCDVYRSLPLVDVRSATYAISDDQKQYLKINGFVFQPSGLSELPESIGKLGSANSAIEFVACVDTTCTVNAFAYNTELKGYVMSVWFYHCDKV